MEKRTSNRSLRRLRVEFSFSGRVAKYSGLTNNVSPTGALILSSVLPPINQRLRVSIQDGTVLKRLDCEVVRHAVLTSSGEALLRHGFGVRFIGAELQANEVAHLHTPLPPLV